MKSSTATAEGEAAGSSAVSPTPGAHAPDVAAARAAPLHLDRAVVDGAPAAEAAAAEAAAAVLETVPLVMRAIRARMREGRPEAVSVPQFRALLFIRRHPGTDLSAVAGHVGTSLPAASELVARLVRADLVIRETDPGSRRRIRLTLSPSGMADLEAAELRTTEWLVTLVQGLDAPQLGALSAGLHHLRALAAAAQEPPSAR